MGCFFWLLLIIIMLINQNGAAAAATWCVTRSDASDEALQSGLDYACAAGADCAPILPNGLCYLPNTLQAHASYAFNSYFQRTAMAAGSCSFSGTATIAKTDPSYGSCVYPSSRSTAGGTLSSGGAAGSSTTMPGTTTPTLATPSPPGTPTPLYEPPGGALTTPTTGPQVPNAKDALAPSVFLVMETILPVSLSLVFSIIFRAM